MSGVCLGRQLFIVLYGGEVLYYELESDALYLRREFYTSDEVVSLDSTPL